LMYDHDDNIIGNAIIDDNFIGDDKNDSAKKCDHVEMLDMYFMIIMMILVLTNYLRLWK
jgi:hypothetical protein